MTWRASSRGVTTIEAPGFRFGARVSIATSRTVRSAVRHRGVIAVQGRGPSTITVKPG